MIEISDEAHLAIAEKVGKCEVIRIEERDGDLHLTVRTTRLSRIRAIVVPAGQWGRV